MESLVYILIGVAVLPFVAVPILVRITQRFSSDIPLRPMQESFLPGEVLTEFQNFRTSLSTYDFEQCFDALNVDDLLGLRFYHRVLMSRIEKTWAICIAVCDGEGQLQKKYVEFKTQFLNRNSFSTHNCDLIGAPIKSSQRKSLALPMETELDALLRIHLFHIKKENLENITSPIFENAVATFKQFLTEDHEDQLALGAIYFDVPLKAYRPTWAGAILIAWYNMWPFTFIRRSFLALKMRLIMREILATNL